MEYTIGINFREILIMGQFQQLVNVGTSDQMQQLCVHYVHCIKVRSVLFSNALSISVQTFYVCIEVINDC